MPNKSMRGLWVWCGLVCFYLGSIAARAWDHAPNGTLKLPLNPQATTYVVEPLEGLPPLWCIGMVNQPGETNRFYCLNKFGAIVLVTNLASPGFTTFLDITERTYHEAESGLLGLAFHPNYRSNGWLYVFYTTYGDGPGGVGIYDRLSRFQVDPANPDRALPDSELIMINQFDEDPYHNSGDLHFGPDGYLYVSLGDEGMGGDLFGNGSQLEKDFFSSILRIDVDGRPGNLRPNQHPAVRAGTYWIPVDNPFVGITNYSLGRLAIWPTLDPAKVHTEFYAIGFRNPWRFTFDSLTGEMYVGDVGQSRREEINLVTKGANYGWPFKEGTLNWAWDVPDGGLTDPLYEYEHEAARLAITGGVLYRGRAYPELNGCYVFSDMSGGIGVLRRDAGGVSVQWIALNPGLVFSLGLHPVTGEILIADGTFGTVNVLRRKVVTGDPLPAKLSATGIFKNLQKLEPAAGIVPYDVNVSFWSDNARKQRWFSVPDPKATFDFHAAGNWQLPTGAVWVKHFDLEMEKGNPDTARRLETRVLVKQTNGVYGATYRWDENGQEAYLVPDQGMDVLLIIQEDGTNRVQRWHYPGRLECLSCHTQVGGYALGFNTAQLNRDVDSGNGLEQQLVALDRAGYFSQPLTNVNPLPRLAAAEDDRWPREYRVRSYFAANCAQCHQPGGPTRALWDARADVPLGKAGIVNAEPVNHLMPVSDSPSTSLRIVSPGSLADSALYGRLATLEGYHMPPLGTTVLNQSALDLVAAWIQEDLPARKTYADWQFENFPDHNAPEAAPDADFDRDGLSNELEFLLGTSPVDPASRWQMAFDLAGGQLRLSYPRLAGRRFEIQWTDNVGDPASWQPLDVPENQYFIGTGEDMIEVLLTAEQQHRFFRVAIFEP